MTNKLITTALRIATSSYTTHPQYNHYLHYSFIIQNNKLIEWGTNLAGEPPLHFGYHSGKTVPKLHSELVAYRRARGLLNHHEPFEMINIRLTRSGLLKISAPCLTCQSWLKPLGCTNVWFSTEGNFGKMRL